MVSKPAWLTCAVVAAAALVLMLPSAQGLAQSPTPTTLPAVSWIGRVVSVTQDLSLRGSVLRVSVAGFKGLPIKVSSGGWSVVGLTGSKPEYGPDVAEFAPIPHGLVVIEPQGLGASMTLTADMTSYITVEFSKSTDQLVAPTTIPSPTSTPWMVVVPTLAPPTATATPWTPVETPTPGPTATPLPLPTLASTGIPLTIEPVVPTVAPTIAALASATPTETATPEPAVQPVTVWQGHVTYTAKGSVFGYGSIVVRVVGLDHLPIDVENGGFHAVATTGTKPEYGAFAAEFGGLGAGEYRITPRGVSATFTVTIGQGEFALVDFNPTLVMPTPERALAPSAEITGSATTLAPGEGATTPLTAASPVPTLVASGATSPTVPLSDTLTSSPFYVLAPPVPVWSGRITQRTSGAANGRLAATIVVRVLGQPHLPVIVDSGGWQARALTGSKPEYGDFAAEFGGLPAGEYDVLPVGLNLRYKVSVERGDFIVVDFTYQVPATPMPMASVVTSTATVSLTTATATGSWSGRVISHTLGVGDTGSIIVSVPGLKGLPVEVKSVDGWSVFAVTDSRQGYSMFISRFDHLTPGRYQVIPQGLGTWIDLPVAKGTETWMEFSPD
jgi:hypothetical protein